MSLPRALRFLRIRRIERTTQALHRFQFGNIKLIIFEREGQRHETRSDRQALVIAGGRGAHVRRGSFHAVDGLILRGGDAEGGNRLRQAAAGEIHHGAHVLIRDAQPEIVDLQPLLFEQRGMRIELCLTCL